jgi:uncharacterized RDD family membrane protein YckC
MSILERTGLLLRRVAAYGIDVLILMIVLLVAQVGLWALELNWAWGGTSPWALQGWVLLTVTVPSWVYFAGLPVWRGRTLGHGLLGLSVVGERAGPAALGRSALRAAIMLLPFEANHVALFHGGAQSGSPNTLFWAAEAVTYGVLAALILSSWLNPRGRGLHDLVGQCSVVRTGQQS